MPSRFAVIPARAFLDLRMSDGLIYVLGGLAMYSSKDNTSKVRQKALGERLGLSRRTINERIRRLEELGYVSQDRTGRTSLYVIIMDADLPPEHERVVTSGGDTVTSDESGRDTSDENQACVTIPPFSSTVLVHQGSDAPPGEHRAVLAYKDVARLWPDRAMRPEIVQTVTDIGLWKAIVRDWIGAGYNKRNVSGILDCYRRGRVDKPGRKANLSPDQTRRINLQDAVKYERDPEERARLERELAALGEGP